MLQSNVVNWNRDVHVSPPPLATLHGICARGSFLCKMFAAVGLHGLLALHGSCKWCLVVMVVWGGGGFQSSSFLSVPLAWRTLRGQLFLEDPLTGESWTVLAFLDLVAVNTDTSEYSHTPIGC